MTNEWQLTAATLAETGLLSWRQIASIVRQPKSTVSDFLRERNPPPDKTQGLKMDKIWVDELEEDSSTKHDNSRILFISDMHIPYHTPGLLEFLKGLKEKYNPTRVICLGDECDKHALSFHDSDPDLDSAGPELEKALPVIKAIEEIFPVMDIVDSNHGSLVYRKAKSHGIPRRYIKSYNDVLGVGAGWKWHFDMTLDLPNGQQLYVHHGKNASAIKVAQLLGMNHISGHYHESFGIQYYSTPTQLLWGANAGCLIDRKSLAFAYNNNNLKRPIIGTVVVIDGKPILETLPL